MLIPVAGLWPFQIVVFFVSWRNLLILNCICESTGPLISERFISVPNLLRREILFLAGTCKPIITMDKLSMYTYSGSLEQGTNIHFSFITSRRNRMLSGIYDWVWVGLRLCHFLFFKNMCIVDSKIEVFESMGTACILSSAGTASWWESSCKEIENGLHKWKRDALTNIHEFLIAIGYCRTLQRELQWQRYILRSLQKEVPYIHCSSWASVTTM